MMWAFLLRLVPSLSTVISTQNKIEFLLTKYDPDREIYYTSDSVADYDNVSVTVKGHDSLPEMVSCLVQKIEDDDLIGIQSGPHLEEHPPVVLPLAELSDDQFAIRYFYKALNYKFDSLDAAYTAIRSSRAEQTLARNRKYEPHLLADIRFSDRMSVLQVIAQLTENQWADERVGLSTLFDKPNDLPMSSVGLGRDQIMNALYADYGTDVVVSEWPTYARLTHRINMVLASLVESGDIVRGGDEGRFYICPKAFATLTNHVDRKVSSKEAREQHRQMYWLRMAAIFLALVGLIPTVFQPTFQWLARL